MESTDFFEVASYLRDILQSHFTDECSPSFEPDQINLHDLIRFTGALKIPTLSYTNPQLYEIVNQKLSFLVSLLEHKFQGECWRGIYVEEDFFFADSLESTDFWFASPSIQIALLFAFYRKYALYKERLKCFKKDPDQGTCILFRIQAHNAYYITSDEKFIPASIFSITGFSQIDSRRLVNYIAREAGDEILIPPSIFSVTGVSQIDSRRLVDHHLGGSHDFISEDIILIEMLQL